MADYKLIVTGCWKAMEERNYARLAEFVHPDCVFVMNGQQYVGLDAFTPVLDGWMTAFPNIAHAMTNCVIQGESLACEVKVTGRHTGTMRTPNGDIPATHRDVAIGAADFVTFAGNKAKRWHIYFDQVALLTQLGLK